jgi:nucleoside-diphosphate-sugar epimerase
MLSGDPALDCWILRLPGLFSESRRSGALFHFMRAAAQGETIRLTPTTATPWDILHVDDAAEAFIHALAAPTRRAGAVNIGYGEPMNLSSVAEWIAVHAAKGSRVVNEGGVEHPVFALGIGKAELLLNWRPPELSSRLDALYVSWNAGFC